MRPALPAKSRSVWLRSSLLFLLVSIAQAAVVSFERQGNITRLKLDNGSAEVEWVTTSTFRFARRWSDEKIVTAPIKPDTVSVSLSEQTGRLSFQTKYLTLDISKADVSLRSVNKEGKVLLASTGMTTNTLDLQAAKDEEFYGFGVRTDPSLDARGLRLKATHPFFISSAGYGLSMRAPGSYTYDVAAARPDRVAIQGENTDHLEFIFFYGPGPKEIMEEGLAVSERVRGGSPERMELTTSSRLPRMTTRLPAAGVCQTVHALVHASMSGALIPAVDLTPFRKGFESSYRLGANVGVVAPLFYESSPVDDAVARDASRFRRRLVPFLLTYFQEAHDRAFPVIHPMPLQYPGDRAGSRLADQFLLGDELLVAPLCTEAARRSVYLPRGLWTDLRTNIQHKGRQRIDVEAPADGPPILARNGSIIPFANEDAPMELHYFPSLAAEFFLWEPDLEEISQFHAGPSADYWRIETESKIGRTYEWILHHKGRPAEVSEGEAAYTEVTARTMLKPGTWFYDASRGNVHVMVEGGAGQDRIINLRFQE